jgi:hypothetical protein
VTTDGSGSLPWPDDRGAYCSFDPEAAGVRGGVCMVDVGGVCLGEVASDGCVWLEAEWTYWNLEMLRQTVCEASLTLETGSETGSKLKLPIRLVCNRDFCNDMARFRSSACASGVRSSRGSGAIDSLCIKDGSGSISCCWEAKRTVWWSFSGWLILNL